MGTWLYGRTVVNDGHLSLHFAPQCSSTAVSQASTMVAAYGHPSTKGYRRFLCAGGSTTPRLHTPRSTIRRWIARVHPPSPSAISIVELSNEVFDDGRLVKGAPLYPPVCKETRPRHRPRATIDDGRIPSPSAHWVRNPAAQSTMELYGRRLSCWVAYTANARRWN